jgi:tRNA-dihydrouridine synthase
MIGRGIFGNPWCFNPNKKEISIEERLRVMTLHTRLFEKKLGGIKNFSIMKKHYKAYVDGFPNAKELRMKLMGTQNADEVEGIVKEFLNFI